MYDNAVLHLYCSLPLSTVNSHMSCASTEGQKIMKTLENTCVVKNPPGKKITPLFLHEHQPIQQG